jgi:ribosomal protein S18 acetylase RimI-like enzyme
MPSRTVAKDIVDEQPAPTAASPGIETGQDLTVEGRAPKLDDRVTVERLGRSRYREAVDLIALAFVDEPGLRYVLGGAPRRRLRVLRPFMWSGLMSFPGSIEVHGATLEGRLVGVGVRMPPGRWPLSRRDEIRGWGWGLLGSLPMLVAFPQAIRVFPRMTELQRHHPHDRPHWYLWCMGVHPSFRRRGVASALARFVLAQADAAGVGCYVETYGDGTEALYRGFGFEVRERWEFEPGAPLARTLWRDPQPRGT